MENYEYDLPGDRIADHPVGRRDRSRLLVMEGDQPREDVFSNIHRYLPEGSLLVFNDTRVVRARLVFHKSTGARIEIFCLEPILPASEISQAFRVKGPVIWKCMIGNARKWRNGKLGIQLDGPHGTVYLEAERMGHSDGAFLVRFTWEPSSLTFAHVLEAAGKVPLPPYIERDAEEDDAVRYQTIYARNDGSVAAPTAGLHFTDEVLSSLNDKGIGTSRLTLHVSAGTFKPVEHDDIRDHHMHTEQILIPRTLVESLIISDRRVIAVGTTSMRTLESLYWYGVLLETDPGAAFHIRQWLPYESKTGINREKALRNVLEHMEDKGLEQIHGSTGLIIVPSYTFSIVDILITNFHMPRSTLLLLVAAFAGEHWRTAYDYALDKGFRFLSYGDSCLFFRNDQ
jgi:S-adenosylmethionine:tRNA ribosyltransferase-isomerase